METYRIWLLLFERNRYFFRVTDRFHISTQMVQWFTNGKRYAFTWLDKGLVPLNIRLFFCARSPETCAEARLARLKVSGSP